MGAVFEAEHTILDGKRGALKLLHPDLACVPEMAERFLREAQTAARLRHPNIVAVEDVIEDELYGPVMVMELLDGETLDRVTARDPIARERQRTIADQALAALEAAHAAGVIHRDVKPGNLLLYRDASGAERVKLLDFGIARTLEGSTLTAPGQFLGTRRYAAPEQVSDTSSADRAADVFSFGAVLFELFTSRRFRSSATGAAEDYVEATLALAAVPQSVAALIRRALARDPAARFQSASELRTALDEALAHPAPDEKIEPPPPVRADLPPTRRTRLGPVVLALGALLVAGVGGVTWWRARLPVVDVARLRDACRLLARTLYGQQLPDGSFAATAHDPTSGGDTAQPLTALVRARGVCQGIEVADELRGLDALARQKGPRGWTNLAVQDRSGYPSTIANAWATLAFAGASDGRLAEARRLLIAGQLGDGSFPLALGPDAHPGSQPYPSVMATWALVESEPAGDPAHVAARTRATAWLRGAMRGTPLRAVPGLADQALYTLVRARARLHDEQAGDEALLRQFTREMLERCAPGGNAAACTRAPTANGRNQMPGIAGKRAELFVSYWWPWTSAVAGALANDPLLDTAARRALSQVAEGAAAHAIDAAPALAAMPSFELSEYLYAVTLLVDSLDRLK
jgi:serine/threonine-protein kinase